jgi:outer membrane protein assembly factor BamE (lipoprotein component of BamABCDE complex)
MFIGFKYHIKKLFITLFIIVTACQLQDPDKNHGIIFLENRANKLVINKSNQNDTLVILGEPHSKSVESQNIWMYVERTLSKGKYHKLGQHVLKSNNVLVLKFDKYGVLNEKTLYDKNDIKKVKFSKKKTENRLTKTSFVESFLSSVKQKMYGTKKN